MSFNCLTYLNCFSDSPVSFQYWDNFRNTLLILPKKCIISRKKTKNYIFENFTLQVLSEIRASSQTVQFEKELKKVLSGINSLLKNGNLSQRIRILLQTLSLPNNQLIPKSQKQPLSRSYMLSEGYTIIL